MRAPEGASQTILDCFLLSYLSIEPIYLYLSPARGGVKFPGPPHPFSGKGNYLRRGEILSRRVNNDVTNNDATRRTLSSSRALRACRKEQKRCSDERPSRDETDAPPPTSSPVSPSSWCMPAIPSSTHTSVQRSVPQGHNVPSRGRHVKRIEPE